MAAEDGGDHHPAQHNVSGLHPHLWRRRRQGDFGRFGAPQASYQVDYDQELVRELVGLVEAEGIPAGTEGARDPALDHGFLVPLHFLQQAMGSPWPCRFVRIGLSGLSFQEHYRLGMLIKKAAEQLDRRVVMVASGDLSHYGRKEGPYGFRPEGPRYDEQLMDLIRAGQPLMSCCWPCRLIFATGRGSAASAAF